VDGFLTYKEAAEYLKVSTETLRRWKVQGKLKAFELGKKVVRFKKEDLDKLLIPSS
jgi:excisionase family DNA binding protein